MWSPLTTFIAAEAPIAFAMVKIALQFKAELENLTGLEPSGDDFRWYVKENHPLKGGRGTASLVLRCKLCSREHSIDILKDSIKSYNADDSPQFRPIVSFECRGVEPTAFSPRVGWVAKGANSESVFEEIDLGEGEWADYDEKANESVGIYEIDSKFSRV